MTTPTVNQAARLRPLSEGYAILAPRRGEWVGLLRKGWVERIDETSPRGGLLPPLRITEAGRDALALAEPKMPEEGQCSETTSARISPSAAGSGERLPSLPSIGWASPLPTPAWRRPSCSSDSLAPLTTRPTSPVDPLPSPEDVRGELDDLWREAEDRALMSQRRGGYNAGHRCWSCHRFVVGPKATCGHCGQVHGGIHHDAYATR